MSGKSRKQTIKLTPQETTNQEITNKIIIANGAGNKPTEVDYHEGDTVASVLQRANLTLGKKSTVSIGRTRIRNIDNTAVKPGDRLVIAGKVSNG